MTTTNDKNLNIGEGEVLAPDDQSVLDDLPADRKSQKLRITIRLDGDIYDQLKDKASEHHTKYQTLINTILRRAIENDDIPLPNTPRTAVKTSEFNELKHRVELLEAALKQQA